MVVLARASAMSQVWTAYNRSLEVRGAPIKVFSIRIK